MMRGALFLICALLQQGALASVVSNHVCWRTGMAGMSFGQTIDENRHELHEQVPSGATYYLYEPDRAIQPFERLIVGLTPLGRQVFSVRLEMHGDKETLKAIIEQTKIAIGESHAGLKWEVIGNHHYGRDVDGVNMGLYVIGDYVQARSTFLLTYGCDSLTYRKMVIEERR